MAPSSLVSSVYLMIDVASLMWLKIDCFRMKPAWSGWIMFSMLFRS